MAAGAAAAAAARGMAREGGGGCSADGSPLNSFAVTLSVLRAAVILATFTLHPMMRHSVSLRWVLRITRPKGLFDRALVIVAGGEPLALYGSREHHRRRVSACRACSLISVAMVVHSSYLILGDEASA